MITKTQRRRLKTYIGTLYIKDVLKRLKELEHFTRDGKPYSRDYVSNVYNGRENNEKIEEAIFYVYNSRKEEVSKKKQKRQEMLQK